MNSSADSWGGAAGRDECDSDRESVIMTLLWTQPNPPQTDPDRNQQNWPFHDMNYLYFYPGGDKMKSRSELSDWSASKQWIICDAMVELDSEFQKLKLIMFFCLLSLIIYSLFESPGKIKSLQLIGLTYNVFYQIVITC